MVRSKKTLKKGAKNKNIKKDWRFWLTLFSILLILAISSLVLILQIIRMQDNTTAFRLYARYNIAKEKTSELINQQNTKEIHIISDGTLYSNLEKIKNELNSHDYATAQNDLNNLSKDLADFNKALQQKYEIEQKNKSEAAIIEQERLKRANNPSASVEIPILIYHKTPPNFNKILDHLASHGYNTISMQALSDHLRQGSPLPAKPIVITFDDGFSDQLSAYEMLRAHHMIATFYVIIGGERSRWCIGIERHNINCGDSYLNWEQIKTLNQSGAIEFGAHTIDHLSLAAYPPSVQSFEIFESKRRLEEMLGHPIVTFAYPYGSFNSTTLDLVRQAGFTSAVTTTAGTSQSLDTIYTLKRIRNALLLP